MPALASSLAYDSAMATNVQVETVIDRPRNTVADYAMDWRNDTSGSGRSARRTRHRWAVWRGLVVERVAGFLGRRIEYVNEVVGSAGARLACAP
jgi:hypothetical protein